MKLNHLITASAIFLSLTSQAQPPDRPVKERVEAMKVGFLTERLNLTPEEAQAFWPVYNKYSDELEALRKTHRENLHNAKQEYDQMGDKDVEKLVDCEIAFRQNELDIMKKYHPQFKQILPVKKVAKLYRSEEEFKRKLLELIQEKKDDRREIRRGGFRRN